MAFARQLRLHNYLFSVSRTAYRVGSSVNERAHVSLEHEFRQVLEVRAISTRSDSPSLFAQPTNPPHRETRDLALRSYAKVVDRFGEPRRGKLRGSAKPMRRFAPRSITIRNPGVGETSVETRAAVAVGLLNVLLLGKLERRQPKAIDGFRDFKDPLKSRCRGRGTQAELNFLRAHKCDEAQGFYFSRPVPAGEFVGLLEHGATAPAMRVVA